MSKASWRERLRYRFDNLFSRGTGAMIASLAIVSLAIIIVSGAVTSLTGVHPEGEGSLGFFEGTWRSLMRTLDAGTMGSDTGWGFRLVMFFTTVGGILIISTLIGVLSNGIQTKVEELRRGRSRVIESGHTVILGWAEQVFTIVSELVEANANQRSPCIVILGNHDKVEMEEEIWQKVGSTGRTRVVCRTGDPIEIADLSVVNLNGSKSILILSPDSDDPDSEVLKIAMAITNYPGRRRDRPFHIVAELKDVKSLEAARVVGKDEVEWVVLSDFVARVIAQTCHQSGLSVIYTELLDFSGDEIYFHQEAGLIGSTFGQTLSAFENNAVMGIYIHDGVCKLNPPMNTVIGTGDQLIVVAEDDDKIMLNGLVNNALVNEGQIVDIAAPHIAPDHLLILGWNSLGPTIIRELACYMPVGSEVMIVAGVENIQQDLTWKCPDRDQQTLSVQFHQGETTDRRLLDSLDLSKYNHVVVLCYSDTYSDQKADAKTLITLLHLRDIADKQGLHFSIVSQMMDVRNRNLADITRADDFIVSDKLISLMMTQVAENKGLNAVFTDLFNPEGSELYLKPISGYVRVGDPVNFYTVTEAARRRDEVALGYRVKSQAQDTEQMYGVHLNPRKSELVIFSPEDRIIVLAES